MCSFKCVSTVDKLPVEQIVVKNEKRHGNILVHSHSQFPPNVYLPAWPNYDHSNQAHHLFLTGGGTLYSSTVQGIYRSEGQ